MFFIPLSLRRGVRGEVKKYNPMNTKNKMSERQTYSSPQIERIKLDNEISLVLSSLEAPGDPGDASLTPDYFNNDPFKLA